MTFVCSNPAAWHPTLHRIEVHHNPPRSWTLDDGASSTLVPLCGLCHNELHAMLNEYIHHHGAPPWPVTKTYSRTIRTLAAKAWATRIEGRTPYTVAHPEDHS